MSDRPAPTDPVPPIPTRIEHELWIEAAADAVDFYCRAFGAEVLHRVGEGDEIVARLAIDDARFWVAASDPSAGRLSPSRIEGATARFLLTVEDPAGVFERAIEAGAESLSPVGEEHGWKVGRVRDPFGNEWEIARPPSSAQ